MRPDVNIKQIPCDCEQPWTGYDSTCRKCGRPLTEAQLNKAIAHDLETHRKFYPGLDYDKGFAGHTLDGMCNHRSCVQERKRSTPVSRCVNCGGTVHILDEDWDDYDYGHAGPGRAFFRAVCQNCKVENVTSR